MLDIRKILQIIPADGWKAQYPEGDLYIDNGIAKIKNVSGYFYTPIICFALVELVNGETEIIGMDAVDSSSTSIMECHGATCFLRMTDEEMDRLNAEGEKQFLKRGKNA